MCLVFVEYRLKPACRDLYLAWAESVKAHYPQCTLYEGTDQRNLFVEVWQGIDEAAYAGMKRARQRSGSESGEAADVYRHLAPLSEWVDGGSEKIHIWRFEKVK